LPPIRPSGEQPCLPSDLCLGDATSVVLLLPTAQLSTIRPKPVLLPCQTLGCGAFIHRPLISGSQVRALVRPPPSLRKSAPFRRQAGKPPLRPFLAISSSHFSGSVKSIRSPGRFRPAGLRPQKSRSRRGRARRRAILALRWCSSFRGCECRGTISTTQSFRTGQFPIGFRSLCAGISAIRSGSFWSLQTRLSLVAILAALSPHLTRLAFRNCEQ